MIGIYARQSIEKHDSISIEAQINKCIALCKYNDWVYEVYKDVGYSGKDLNRPQFKNLMTNLSVGKIKKVICYRLDRISRSMADFSQLILKFEEYGVEFISATENFDTSTPLGRAMVNIIMTFAQLERETITARVTDNYYFRGNQGYWPGGPPPFGYNITKKIFDGKKQSVLEVNTKETEIVKTFYDWYLEYDGSIRKIITKANELGIKTRNGSMWTSRVVADMLWKPLYTSNTIKIYNFFKSYNANIENDITEFDGSKAINLYGKTNKNSSKHKRCREIDDQYLIISEHKPIIEDDKWLKVQAKKGFKLQSSPRTGQSKNSYLTGLLYCTYCNYSISIMKCKHRYKDNVYENRYYVCSTRKNRGKGICELPIIPANKLEEKITHIMINHYKSAEIQNLLNSPVKKESLNSEYITKKNGTEMKLTSIKEEIENLINSLATGSSTLSKYIEKKIDELEINKTILEKNLQKLDEQEFGQIIKLENLEYVKECSKNLESKIEQADFDEMKYIYNTLIKKIYLSSDSISVIFTI